ncbi:hypothetical protein CS8_091030 [Cupriavidus sp. 8B]
MAKLTTTQFEELQATMERRSGESGEIGIPGRIHLWSPSDPNSTAKESSSFVTALGSADCSRPAAANEPQIASALAAVVKVEMADDATVVAGTPGIGSTQHSNAVADPSAFSDQQRAVLVLLLDGLPNKILAQRLAMTERAVQDHVKEILGCFGVTNRKQVIPIVKRQWKVEVLGSKRSRTDPGARHHNGPTRQAGTIPSAPAARPDLTQRQGSVLNLLLEGLSNKLIARRLGLTVNTVKEHVSAILLRLDLRSRAEVISRMEPHVAAARRGDSVPLTAAAAVEQDGTIELAQRAPITPEALGLTQRQGSVLVLLLEGLPNKIIARRLGLTEGTVKEHVSGILQRLEVRTRTEAMLRMKPFHVQQIATEGTP